MHKKRDTNKPGWPYIGPVVKDIELQVRTVCDAYVFLNQLKCINEY